MRGWLRYFALNAQLRTGLSAAVLISAIIAAVAAVGAATFLLVALFVWLADLYDGVIAGVVIGCAFALIALIALLSALMTLRRNMERARVELAARRSNLFDPKLAAVAMPVGQAIGWGRLAPPVALPLPRAGGTKEGARPGKAVGDGGTRRPGS